jgi:hypothetical protein
MELGIPVVVPAQLNRNPSARADGRPTKADLRESGQIEQDADVVILLWRRPIEVDPHTKAIGPDPHNLTLIVDKNRHGPKDEFQLRWNGGYGTGRMNTPGRPTFAETITALTLTHPDYGVRHTRGSRHRRSAPRRRGPNTREPTSATPAATRGAPAPPAASRGPARLERRRRPRPALPRPRPRPGRRPRPNDVGPARRTDRAARSHV